MNWFLPNNRIKRLVQEFSWVAVGQVITVLGSLMLLRALTESLDPTKFGQLALALTIAGLINAVIMGGLVNGIGRFYSVAVEKNDVSGYLHGSFRIICYATVAVVIVGLVMIAVLIWFGYFQWIGLMIAALIFSVLAGYNAALNGIQNAARERKIVAFHSGLDPWLKILFVLGVTLWLGSSSTAVVLCYAVVCLLLLISQLLFLRHLPNSQGTKNSDLTKKDWVRKIWLFSWPFIVWGVPGWAQISSSRWALQAFGSTADVGYYSVLSQLGYVPIQTIMGVFMAFITPVIYSMAGSATDESRRENVSILVYRMVLVGIVITMVATFFTYFLHRQIMTILVSEEYWLVSEYLPVLVAAGGIFAVALVISAKHLSFMSPKQLMPANIGSSLIGFTAAFIGVYYYSFVGAVFAMLIHSASYLIMLLMVNSPMEALNEPN